MSVFITGSDTGVGKTQFAVWLLRRLRSSVVAENRLGCLNHTLLTIRSVEAHGLMCAGVVLNNFGSTADIASKTNPEVLQQCLTVPIVADFRNDLSEIPDWLRGKCCQKSQLQAGRSLHRESDSSVL